MKIDTNQNGATLVISIEGRLESSTAPQLDEIVKAIPANVTELIMDLGQMEYTSSAGLRVILSAHKIMKAKNGMLKIRNVTATVKKLFDLTAFTPILNFI